MNNPTPPDASAVPANPFQDKRGFAAQRLAWEDGYRAAQSRIEELELLLKRCREAITYASEDDAVKGLWSLPRQLVVDIEEALNGKR